MTSTITGSRRYNIMQASEAVYKTQEAHKHMTIFKLKQWLPEILNEYSIEKYCSFRCVLYLLLEILILGERYLLFLCIILKRKRRKSK